MYRPGDFDLAGFAVGAMERGAGLPRGVAEGDVLLGLASSGLHSNGFSLVRRVAETAGLGWDDALPLRPTARSARRCSSPRASTSAPPSPPRRPAGLHALAHITGGGLTENLPRVLPDGLGAEVDLDAWTRPAVFEWLRGAAGIAEAEMLRTFNCGVGMVAVVASERAARARGAAGRGGRAGRARSAGWCRAAGVRYAGRL